MHLTDPGHVKISLASEVMCLHLRTYLDWHSHQSRVHDGPLISPSELWAQAKASVFGTSPSRWKSACAIISVFRLFEMRQLSYYFKLVGSDRPTSLPHNSTASLLLQMSWVRTHNYYTLSCLQMLTCMQTFFNLSI